MLTEKTAKKEMGISHKHITFFDLGDHLGNVLATVLDRKTGQIASVPTLYDHYLADVETAQDYYPFGMLMPDRTINSESSRFGFNGQEKVDEIAGVGNNLDYGERGYDPRRIGWWSPDKLAGKYPGVSPYVFCRNNPIIRYDPDGNTDYTATVQVNKNTKGEITKTITVNMVYALINISKNAMFNANEVSGGQYKASAFTGSTSYQENGKTVNVNIQTNIQYRLADNISQVKKGENVMLIVDDALPMPGDKHTNVNPVARGAFEGNVIAVETKYKNNLNAIWHEMGHNLGFWFADNKLDHAHSPNSSNLMYKNITNSTSISPEDLNSGFADVIKKDAGTYNIEGMRGGNVQSKTKDFLNANYKYDQSKAQKAGL